MLKEIEEQPQVIERALVQDKRFLMEIALDILRAKNVVITACGTSRYAALIGRYLFSKLGGKFCDVVIGSEFQYFADSIDRNTVVIAVSQSGETADVVEGVKKAKEAGARVISIVNVKGSQLCRISDRVVYTNCGPEICVAATKSFVGQLIIFYLLAFTMENHLVQGIKELRELSVLIDNNLRENGLRLKELVEKFKNHEHFYYIARGPNFAIAAEGALKLKEISYIHAEGMPAGELKHGTLALIEEGAPVVALCPKDHTYFETHGNALETKARGAFLIGVSDVSSEDFDFWVRIPQVKEIFYPLVEVIPLQLLAYHLAVAREKDPDRPRNLAKSVTVK
jgi:glucosamine--fructose-6-phosphate aminotransferase (isomerizing)